MMPDHPPELHRPTPTDRVPAHGITMEVVANQDERNAVAGRLQEAAVEALSCRFVLSRPLASARGKREGEIVAEGHLRATLLRECVVTLELFHSKIDERFRIRFVPSGSEANDEDPESDDEIPYEGAAIDLGEAAVEQLALTLDPYPRKPGATLPDEATDAESGPFAGLARLVKPD
jgi:uncharacterized metal-binding protein YceD (DUF177 family)